jgi:O-antigen ligase
VPMLPRLTIAPETTVWMTRPFVAATLLAGPLLGSAVSAAMVLAFLLGVFQLLNDNYEITQSRQQRLIFITILAWFATEAVFGLLHFNGRPTMFEIAENLPFLGYIIFVSGMELSNKQDLRRIIYVWSPIAAFATLALASVQIQIGPHRAEGAAGNAGPFAALCLILFSSCVITAVETGGRSRLLSIAGAGAAAVCVILSGMRGFWPCLMIIPIALAITYKDTLKGAPRRVFPAAALVVLAVLFLTHGTIEKRVLRLGSEIERLQSSSGPASSVEQHVLIWQAGWSLLREAPLAGHGLGRNHELMAVRTKEISGAPISLSHFHNAILTQGVQSGIIGILGLLAMFLAPLWLSFRQPRSDSRRHGLAIILSVTIIYAVAGATAIMFGHDLMDAGWIAAVSYGSFMVFGHERLPATAQYTSDSGRPGSSESDRL